jgi:hypothetical protein
MSYDLDTRTLHDCITKATEELKAQMGKTDGSKGVCD